MRTVTTVYRGDTRPSLHLAVGGELGFWRRLQIQLRAVRQKPMGCLMILIALVPAISIAAALAAVISGWAITTTIVIAASTCAAIALAATGAGAVWRSLVPTEERQFPAALTLREDTIRVEPHDEPAYDTDWGYIVHAASNDDWSELVLSTDPLRVVRVPHASLAPTAVGQLRAWLSAHGKLRL